MAEVAGLEPANAGVKVPCLRPLGYTPRKMVVSARGELATHALGGHRSIHLSYETRMERISGIEPPFFAWKANVLPMNYIRMMELTRGIEPPTC